MERRKTIIIGAGLSGLIHGILLKKARQDDNVIIFDQNSIPGGFCTAFEKATVYNNEKIKYTINIPLITSDFNKDEPFDLFLKYIGVENLKWKVVEKMFCFYPLNGKPFVFTKKSAVEDMIKLAGSKKEADAIRNFFNKIARFYRDIFHKAYAQPTPLQSIELLFKIPSSIMTLMSKKTYKQLLDSIGIKTRLIQEILSAAEAFLGSEADTVSAVAEMFMIQTFLENDALQPASEYTFQDLSNRLAKRFKDLGGELILNTEVNEIIFSNNKASGVRIKDKIHKADFIVLAVAQDRIKGLIQGGDNIPRIKRLLKKISKLKFPNADFYSYFLVDKKLIEENPRLIDIAYHVYRLPDGALKGNWKMPMWIPNKLYNNKYYIMECIATEKDQKKVDWWIELRKSDYKKYVEEKKKFSEHVLQVLQAVEPALQKYSPLKNVLSISPASYQPYGSKYPISGLANTPDNFGATRMKPILLDNLFITGSASFSSGVWGAIAGSWQGFVMSYEKAYKVKIGNHDIFYKPGLKNLP